LKKPFNLTLLNIPPAFRWYGSAGIATISVVFNVLQAAPTQQQAAIIQLTVNPHEQPAIQFEAKAAPLKQILNQFTLKTGATIHYSVLPEEPVTATCAGDSVKAVMECLLGNKVDRVYRKLNPQNAAITLTKHAAIPKEEIWILGARYGNTSNMSCTLDANQPEAAANETDTLPQQALLNMAQIISDPRYSVIGKQALSILAAQGKTGDAKTDAEIVQTLEGALKDKNPEARAQAIFGLSQHDSNNTEILHEALQDKNSDVRLMAVDRAMADTSQGRAVLSEALNDSDATVRALAEQKLNAAEQQ
jgi:HEAT repeats